MAHFLSNASSVMQDSRNEAAHRGGAVVSGGVAVVHNFCFAMQNYFVEHREEELRMLMAHQITAIQRATPRHSSGLLTPATGTPPSDTAAALERESAARDSLVDAVVVDTNNAEAMSSLVSLTDELAGPTDPHVRHEEEVKIALAEEQRSEVIRGIVRKSIEAAVILPLRPELWEMLKTDQEEESNLVRFIQTLRFEHQVGVFERCGLQPPRGVRNKELSSSSHARPAVSFKIANPGPNHELNPQLSPNPNSNPNLKPDL